MVFNLNQIEEIKQNLLLKGYVKLAPLADTNTQEALSKNIIAEMNGAVFKQNGKCHIDFLDKLKLQEKLAKPLFELAKNEFNFSGDLSDQYHIARSVDPGNSREQFRAHFDSHLFTLVIPMQIPEANFFGEECGELIFRPQARRHPKSEIENVFGKAWFKGKFSKQTCLQRIDDGFFEVADFSDYSPLLFLGRTTLHTNQMVATTANSKRLTLLAHYFDPSPPIGVGAALRYLRGR